MSDVVVIGGGIIGMMTARELTLRGARVTLLERGRVGGESSWAGGGIISALVPWRAAEEVNQLIGWGHRHYPQLWQALRKETNIDAQWCRSGMGVMASDVDTAVSWSKGFGLDAEILSTVRAEVELQGVQLASEDHSLVYLPEVGQIRNPRLIKALRSSLRGLGVVIHEYCAVENIDKQTTHATTIKTANQTFFADKVVLTVGAWAEQLLPELQRKCVKPMRGEMLLYKAEPGLLKRIVVSEDCYLVPRNDGHILCGSTVDDVGFNHSTTKEALSLLSLEAERIFPCIKDVPIVGHWAGLRPGSSNGIPVISRSNEYENVFVSCGHFRNGIAMAPASAQLMSDLVEGIEPSIDSAPYALG